MSTNNMAASWRQANDVIAPSQSDVLMKIFISHRIVNRCGHRAWMT